MFTIRDHLCECPSGPQIMKQKTARKQRKCHQSVNNLRTSSEALDPLTPVDRDSLAAQTRRRQSPGTLSTTQLVRCISLAADQVVLKRRDIQKSAGMSHTDAARRYYRSMAGDLDGRSMDAKREECKLVTSTIRMSWAPLEFECVPPK
uniref:Uncharacterized protein n=1 Tax=Steinernema glaseri TaxID=37863 RepID=A0A1I8A273_9BILA